MFLNCLRTDLDAVLDLAIVFEGFQDLSNLSNSSQIPST